MSATALTALLASLASANPADPSGSNEPETKVKLESIAKQLGSLLSEAPTFDPNVAGGQVSSSCTFFAYGNHRQRD